jgi:hypothetical protein
MMITGLFNYFRLFLRRARGSRAHGSSRFQNRRPDRTRHDPDAVWDAADSRARAARKAEIFLPLRHLSLSKCTIFRFSHVVAPFGSNREVTDAVRWQVREAMAQAVFEGRSIDNSIIGFAELIVRCGLLEGSGGEPGRLVTPEKAVELAEAYYRQRRKLKEALAAGSPESERIELSKEVYASEKAILQLFDTLRELYVALERGGGRQGFQLDPLSGVRDLFVRREEQLDELKRLNAFEEAYITRREKPAAAASSNGAVKNEDAASALPLDAALKLIQAMSKANGSGAPPPAAPQAPEEPPAPARRRVAQRAFKGNGDFSAQDKDRLIELIYGCQAANVELEKEYEALEAMVYTKPHEVAVILSSGVDDQVFYR